MGSCESARSWIATHIPQRARYSWHKGLLRPERLVHPGEEPLAARACKQMTVPFIQRIRGPRGPTKLAALLLELDLGNPYWPRPIKITITNGS